MSTADALLYVAHYGFDGRPFQLVPDPRFFFASRAHREALADLVRALSAAEGLLLLVGPVGIGKTMLVDYLLAELGPAKFEIGRLAPARSMAGGLGPAILDAFIQRAGGSMKVPWRRRLERHLRARAKARRRVLLVIDEAQTLEPEDLEELRAWVDLNQDGRPLLQVLLVAQPTIRRRLGAPELEAVRQRLVMVREVGPLSADEVRGYVEHRLRTVGWTGRPAFADDAFQAIFEHGRGVPRATNMLCARLLALGAGQERDRFGAGDVAGAAEALATEGAAAGGGDAGTASAGRSPWPATSAAAPASAFPSGARRPAAATGPSAAVPEAELARLRRQLRQIELDRLKTDAELARRLIGNLERPGLTRPAEARGSPSEVRFQPHFA